MTNGTNQTRADRLIIAMLQQINKHDIKLMDHYPDDLLKHDRQVLDILEGSSATLGWCVGDTHTHLAVLGVHPEENQAVTYYLNLSSNDRFYKIALLGTEDFKMTEVNREQFEALKSTKVPYTAKGGHLNFVVFKNEAPIASCYTEVHGAACNRSYKVAFRELSNLSSADKMAVEYYASHGIRKHKGSLFFKAESTWLDTTNRPVNQQESALK